METLLLSAVTLSASLALFVALYKLVKYETVRGERLLFGRLRGGVDWVIDILMYGLQRIKLLTRRSFATFQKKQTDRALTEALVRHATHTPLTVTHTNNHLSQMRDHKSETALTPAQGRKLRKKKLEERF